MSDIYPAHAPQAARSEREGLLRQRGHVLWLYGLSGSGKSTVAHLLERRLMAEGHLVRPLDGDHLRAGLNLGLGFGEDARRENVRRAAEVARLFVDTGVVTIASFITPRQEFRRLIREILGADVTLAYVRASYATCAGRDPKGLYQRAEAGTVTQFTGKDAGFDEPTEETMDLLLDTEALSAEACANVAHDYLRPRIHLS